MIQKVIMQKRGVNYMKLTTFKRDDETEEVFQTLKIGLYIALQLEIIPSLRAIGINWKPGQKEALLIFFHDAQIDSEVYDHYSSIETEATTYSEPKYRGDTILMRIDDVCSHPFPKPIPKVSEVVYLRKEPGFEFNEINRYIPDWACTSIIRLKINEALRGKVTPDLRQIQFRWTKPEKEALVTYIHNAPVTPEVEAHYKEIFEIATAVPWRHEEGIVTPYMEVLSVPYPNPIPRNGLKEIFYLRREPFEDPKDEYE